MKLTYNDAQHMYRLDGKACKSVTNVAKIPDDTYYLEKWRSRQVLIGVAVQPSLVERAAAHFDDKEIMDRLAEEAMQSARSHEAAGRGTAAHRIAERVDLDELIIDSPQARAVQAAWAHALELAGLEIVREYVERITVYPEHRIAGRFDRLARRKADGKLVVLDIKTGANAVKYPHSMAVQLALYANAPLMAARLFNGSTERFDPMPDVDKTVGYVVHMPNDEQVDVVGVDIAAGWQAAQVCFKVIGWRANKELLIPVTEIEVAPETSGEVAAGHSDTAAAPELASSARPTGDGNSAGGSARTDWIKTRLAALKANPTARQLTADKWPWVVPTKPPWTDEQIDLLDEALAAVETAVEAPFPPIDPTNPKGIRP